MNVDAILFALLALMDLAIIVYLRRRRASYGQCKRVSRSLRFVVQRELKYGKPPQRRRILQLHRA